MKQIILNFSEVKLGQSQDKTVEITEDTQLLGIFVGREKQNVQMKLRVVHKKPGLKSLTLVKAVLLERSKFDFTGELVIEKGAQLTDTYLRCDVLMMSPQASAKAVPCLEISETNVKGGHGATVGMIDSEQLFLCMSRGMSLADAQYLLAKAFVRQVADMANVADEVSGSNEVFASELAKLEQI